jgi:hypothetical protein
MLSNGGTAMSGLKKNFGLIIILVAALLLSSCASKQPDLPFDTNMLYTQVVQMYYTQAVQTVHAEFTQTASVDNPVSTPEPAANQPMATADPANAAVVAVTVAPVNSVPTQPLFPTPTDIPPMPTLTPGPVADKAEWVSQYPYDGMYFLPGQNFTVTWRLQNTGETTWSAAYQYRFYSGTVLHTNASSYFLPVPKVKPGQAVDLSFNAKAPSEPGEYFTNWVLTNGDGINFYTINLKMFVEP